MELIKEGDSNAKFLLMGDFNIGIEDSFFSDVVEVVLGLPRQDLLFKEKTFDPENMSSNSFIDEKGKSVVHSYQMLEQADQLDRVFSSQKVSGYSVYSNAAGEQHLSDHKPVGASLSLSEGNPKSSIANTNENKLIRAIYHAVLYEIASLQPGASVFECAGKGKIGRERYQERAELLVKLLRAYHDKYFSEMDPSDPKSVFERKSNEKNIDIKNFLDERITVKVNEVYFEIDKTYTFRNFLKYGLSEKELSDRRVDTVGFFALASNKLNLAVTTSNSCTEAIEQKINAFAVSESTGSPEADNFGFTVV